MRTRGGEPAKHLLAGSLLARRPEDHRGPGRPVPTWHPYPAARHHDEQEALVRAVRAPARRQSGRGFRRDLATCTADVIVILHLQVHATCDRAQAASRSWGFLAFRHVGPVAHSPARMHQTRRLSPAGFFGWAGPMPIQHLQGPWADMLAGTDGHCGRAAGLPVNSPCVSPRVLCTRVRRRHETP